MPYDGAHMKHGVVAACVVLLGCGGGRLQVHSGRAEAGTEEEDTGGGDNRLGTTVGPQSRRHGEPPIAILGLEVHDNGGVDREAVRAGLELRVELPRW